MEDAGNLLPVMDDDESVREPIRVELWMGEESKTSIPIARAPSITLGVDEAT
jgi:hypothetical protein